MSRGNNREVNHHLLHFSSSNLILLSFYLHVHTFFFTIFVCIQSRSFLQNFFRVLRFFCFSPAVSAFSGDDFLFVFHRFDFGGDSVPSPAAVLFRHNRFRLHLVIIVRISDFCAFRRRFFHHVYFGGPVHTPAAITCFCHNGLHVSFGSNCVIQLLIVMISSLILTVLFKNDLVNV